MSSSVILGHFALEFLELSSQFFVTIFYRAYSSDVFRVTQRL